MQNVTTPRTAVAPVVRRPGKGKPPAPRPTMEPRLRLKVASFSRWMDLNG